MKSMIAGAPEKEPEGILYLLFYPGAPFGRVARRLSSDISVPSEVSRRSAFAQKGEGSRKEKSRAP